jgi:diguanylate cyclase (GGDEF)-like protein
MESVMDIWFKELSGISQEKKEFIDDLEKRIIINTQNLFYFLKKKDYLEILPLYSSLLSIYKLTLLLNNLLTVELASNTIENLRIDSLSKLLRKESFMEFLKNEIHYAQREEGYIFSLAYLDLDNFKSINDTFGHYSGDKVIEKFGEIIKNATRGSDMAFRIGGDEFAIIFKKAKKEDAKKVCQKITQEFSSHEFVFNKDKCFSVGVSVGVAEFSTGQTNNYEDMIRLVDEKLYDAKKAGKNQVTS